MSTPGIIYGQPATRREREIARLYILDRGKKQAASDLGVTHNTIRAALRHLYTKIGVSTQMQLVGWALRERVITARELAGITPKGRYHGE